MTNSVACGVFFMYRDHGYFLNFAATDNVLTQTFATVW